MTRDLAVQYFGKVRFVHLGFPLHSEGDRGFWAKVEAYVETIFTLANKRGNFWFCCQQLELEGANGDDIKHSRLSRLPSIRGGHFVIPRWLVTGWLSESHKAADGSLVRTKATH